MALPAGSETAAGGPRSAWYFLIVAAIDISILIAGHGITAKQFSTPTPPGLAPVAVLGALGAAAMAGFIFASVANSCSPGLASILHRRAAG
jgi:hypothetical protein